MSQAHDARLHLATRVKGAKKLFDSSDTESWFALQTNLFYFRFVSATKLQHFMFAEQINILSLSHAPSPFYFRRKSSTVAIYVLEPTLLRVLSRGKVVRRKFIRYRSGKCFFPAPRVNTTKWGRAKKKIFLDLFPLTLSLPVDYYVHTHTFLILVMCSTFCVGAINNPAKGKTKNPYRKFESINLAQWI